MGDDGNDRSRRPTPGLSSTPPSRQPPTSTALVSLSDLVADLPPPPPQATLPSMQPSVPEPIRVERLSTPPVGPISVTRGTPKLPPPSALTLRAEVIEMAAPRLVRVRYPIDEAWLDPYGALQGGFLAAMIDNVIGMCAYATDPNRPASLIELSVRYFRALRAGHVIIDGTVLRAGRATLTVECVAWDGAREMCAKATATNLFLE